MAVVTITRQHGAGGSLVAQLVARALGWTVIDNEFVEAVASRAGLTVETVAAHEERAPSLMERLVSTLATASPEMFVPAGSTDEGPTEEQIVRVTARIIAEAAQHGRAVLVGRGAQAVLASSERGETLHVWVVAPREARLATLMQRLGVDEKAAAAAMDDSEANRDRYVHKWHGRSRPDPANYHIVVNTGFLGYEAAADLIVAAARQRGWGGA